MMKILMSRLSGTKETRLYPRYEAGDSRTAYHSAIKGDAVSSKAIMKGSNSSKTWPKGVSAGAM